MKASNIKREGGKLVYRGEKFEGFNKPKSDTSGAKTKKVVLAKKGDEVKRFALVTKTTKISDNTKTLSVEPTI